MTTLAVAAVGRPTFDVELAQATADRALAVLQDGGFDLVGDADLLLDAAAVDRAADGWRDHDVDALVVLQATFADSTLVARLADTTAAPLVLWAFPEPRTGGRLRLNSLCGINLASYVLRRDGRDYRWLFRDPDADAGPAVRRAVEQPHAAGSEPPGVDAGHPARAAAARVAEVLAETRIGVIGEHPDGFEPCGYDPASLAEQVGPSVVAVPLPRLFDVARAADGADVAAVRSSVTSSLDGAASLDGDAVDQSIRLHLGLRQLVDDERLGAVATRCWPECFTEFGAAACTPQALLTDAGVPATCEADVYGSATALVLRELTGEPPFVADLVDLDPASDTGVFWHCGIAPLALADDQAAARATVHSNRRKPLLNEFPLKPGRVTLARLSQSGNRTRLVIGGGEMLRAPLAFSGTGGVVRFDRPVTDVLDTIMGEGLEHHYGIGYGDVRAELHALADRLGLDVVVL